VMSDMAYLPYWAIELECIDRVYKQKTGMYIPGRRVIFDISQHKQI